MLSQTEFEYKSQGRQYNFLWIFRWTISLRKPASSVPTSHLVEMVKEDEGSAGAFPLGLVGLPLVGLQLKVICGSWVGHCYLLVSSLVWGQFRVVKQQTSGKMFTHFTPSQSICDDLQLGTSSESLCCLLKSGTSFMYVISTHTLC